MPAIGGGGRRVIPPSRLVEPPVGVSPGKYAGQPADEVAGQVGDPAGPLGSGGMKEGLLPFRQNPDLAGLPGSRGDHRHHAIGSPHDAAGFVGLGQQIGKEIGPPGSRGKLVADRRWYEVDRHQLAVNVLERGTRQRPRVLEDGAPGQIIPLGQHREPPLGKLPGRPPATRLNRDHRRVVAGRFDEHLVDPMGGPLGSSAAARCGRAGFDEGITVGHDPRLPAGGRVGPSFEHCRRRTGFIPAAERAPGGGILPEFANEIGVVGPRLPTRGDQHGPAGGLVEVNQRFAGSGGRSR